METNLHEQADDKLERQILMSMILDNETIQTFSDLTKGKEVFYNLNHTVIADVIQDLFNKGLKVDISTVAPELKRRNLKIDVYYLLDIAKEVATSANFEHNIRRLLEFYMKREIVKMNYRITQKVQKENGDVFDVIQEQTEMLGKLTNFDKVFSKSVLMQHYVELMERRIFKKTMPVFTYIYQLDNLIGGFQPGEYIVIGARPSMGKTGLGLTIAYNNFLKNVPTLFISMEMSSEAIFDRLVGFELGIESRRLRNGRIADPELNSIYQFMDKVREKPIFIDDRAALNVIDIRNLIKEHVKRHNLKVVLIDYLGFIKSLKSHNTRDREIAEISAELKSMAKDLGVVLILLVQINRQVEQRTSKKPILADIRDSGTIEQDADTVIFIHRPEYYGSQTFESGESCLSRAKLCVLKGRNTGTGDIICNYNTQLAYFTDLEDSNSQEEAF